MQNDILSRHDATSNEFLDLPSVVNVTFFAFNNLLYMLLLLILLLLLLLLLHLLTDVTIAITSSLVKGTIRNYRTKSREIFEFQDI